MFAEDLSDHSIWTTPMLMQHIPISQEKQIKE